MTGVTAAGLLGFLSTNGIPLRMRGIAQPVAVYGLFAFWRIAAMSIPMPLGNAAHSGPVFLPWHRIYTIRLEQRLQRVLGQQEFGLLI